MIRLEIEVPDEFVDALAELQKREQRHPTGSVLEAQGLKEFFVGFFTAFAVHNLGHIAAERFAAANGFQEKYDDTFGRRANGIRGDN